MKLTLWPQLLRWKPREVRDAALESILDIRQQNAFLRMMVLLMGFAVAFLALRVFLKPESSGQTILVSSSSGVAYADDVGSRPTPTPPPQPEEASDAAAEEEEEAEEPEVHERLVASGNRPAKAKPALPPAVPAAASPRQEQPAVAAARAPAPAGLWELLERIRRDPGREMLDKEFESSGLRVFFHEATQDGLLHFELLNAGERPIYLPRLETPGLSAKVFLERRVLEPGSRTQGVLALPGWEGRATLEVSVAAANLKPVTYRLEVPSWR